MSVSGAASQKLSPGRRDVFMLAALVLAMLLAMFLGSRDFSDPDIFWRGEGAVLVESDDSRLSTPGFRADTERELALSEVGGQPGVVWLRIELDLDAANIPHQPIALYLSGPFSAEVYWDGQHLGDKGRVGASADLEQPGPIDATFHIPDGWAGPGRHFLVFRVSAFHVGYTPDELFHVVALGGFRADPRRELRYYAWPLLLSGAFVLIGLLFMRMYIDSGAMRALLSAGMALFVLLQLLAEVSRALVAYDYQWHLLRSIAIWVTAVNWGLCWQWAVWCRGRDAVVRAAIPVNLVVALLVAWMTQGFDTKTAGTIGVLALMPLCVAIYHLAKRDIDAVLVADGMLAAALVAMAWWAPDSLLDRVVYFLLVLHLGATWLWLSAGRQSLDPAVESVPADAFFSVKLAGRQMRVSAEDVVYLQAEGNFTELVTRDGKRYLHQHRLGQIMRSPPPGFVRIQRSYAINTAYLDSLRSLEGSRYQLQLSTGDTLPVSRYRVVELRALMGAH